MNNESLLTLQLSLVDGIGPVAIKRLFSKGLELLMQKSSIGNISRYYGIKHSMAQAVFNALQCKRAVHDEMALAKQHGIRIITRSCSTYPTVLTHIHAPPSVLYVCGDMASLAHDFTVAFVGSRDTDYTAAEIVASLVNPVALAGCTVVSGGARGIDTLAHRVALKAKRPTVVVLGSGILRPYPAENVGLFEEVSRANGSSVISIFPLRMPPRAAHFPARNRVIAGLSQVCVVVQAAQKSGALITGKYALDMGKEVLAVPGSILNPRFFGCNDLIKQGAGLVQSYQDILNVIPNYHNLGRAAIPTYVQQSIAQNPVREALASGPKDFSTLLLMTQLSGLDLEETLFEMSMEGDVVSHPNGKWALQ